MIRRSLLVSIAAAAVALLGIVGCDKLPRRVTASSPSRLIVLVHGTFAGDANWNRQDVPQPTLAKTLAANCSREDRVVAFRWSGGVSHSDRITAANSLVRFVAKNRRLDDKVVLVGHSHGGNVSLMAAANSSHPIDAIFCLGTPHIYFHHRTEDGSSRYLPVYCSPRTLENTSSVIAIRDPEDRVAEEWSNLLITGISQNEAIQATADWQRVIGTSADQVKSAPPVADRLFESGRLFAKRKLSLATHDLTVGSAEPRLLGVSPHLRLHAPELGRVIAETLEKQR